jgi:hypothetical protein
MTDREKKERLRSAADLTALDDFLVEQGKLAKFKTQAMKEVHAWQTSGTEEASKRSKKNKD